LIGTFIAAIAAFRKWMSVVTDDDMSPR